MMTAVRPLSLVVFSLLSIVRAAFSPCEKMSAPPLRGLRLASTVWMSSPVDAMSYRELQQACKRSLRGSTARGARQLAARSVRSPLW